MHELSIANSLVEIATEQSALYRVCIKALLSTAMS